MSRIFTRWQSLGAGASWPARLGRALVYAVLLFLAFECITIDFRWPEQAMLGIIIIAVAYAIHKTSGSELVTLSLMFASVSATARYCYWRCATVSSAVTDPAQHTGLINFGFMLLLLFAELYAFLILFLGYIQTARPLGRRPAPLPREIDEWPDVDIVIPTYNEPLSIVRSTVFAAINVDYPPEKLHVYVCDDGRRAEFRTFCNEIEIGYIVRKDNLHAKAGNINHALQLMSSPYVAIFDCDHVPTRSFLQMTMGWFFRDGRLGLVQTPHYFYSPDPFERNLSQFKVIPNEGELFYGVLQDGNDLWNATFFCGSCAVLRRTALDEVGGIAVETVTEDAHTSLRMQMRGWSTAYINIPQAAGLATESLSSHVGQRVRWARGMVQVLRTDNPLTAKGLEWPQRLCYFNAMIHFLYAVPRLIFLTAPLVYMLLGRINIPGQWLAILAYAMPHLFLSNVVNFRVQGKHRYSFWNEVYETVLAPYILFPTLLALINPKFGKFNVTAKGGIVSKSYFDRHIARPYVALILLNVFALCMAPVRYFLWDAGHRGTVLMNVVWILFNMIIVGTANATAIESKQLRNSVRIDLRIPMEVRLAEGRSVFGESANLSLTGGAIALEEPLPLTAGAAITVVFPLRGGEVALPAVVVRSHALTLRLKYEELSIKQEELLTLVLYSRADTWLARSEQRVKDRPLHSFLRLLQLSVRGVGYALTSMIPRKRSEAQPNIASATASVLFAALLLGSVFVALTAPARAAQPLAPTPAAQAAGAFRSSFTLKDIGSADAVQFRGIESTQSIPFALPQTEVVQGAKLNLHYAFSSGLLAQLSHLNVLLNGVLVATLPVPPHTGTAPQQALLSSLTLPAELLVRNNVLSFQFIGHYTQSCEDPSNTVLWARVDNDTELEVTGSYIALSGDLKQLPLPFFDGAVSTSSASIPFAFAAQPGPKAMQAAGVLSSWFGVRAKARALSFPVTVGADLPKGNIVLFAENGSELPPDLAVEGSGPRLAVRTNPSDPYGKVLILAGDDGDQLLAAARSLALSNSLLQGSTAHIANFELPPARHADDAPLWMSTEQTTPLWNYSEQNALQSDGSGALRAYLRLPPDLYFGDRTTLPLHLDYRYNAVPIANGSTLRVSANDGLVNEMPLPHQSEPQQQLAGTLAIPMIDVRPFANTLLFNFYFQIAKKGYCQDTPPINLLGAILRSSYVDIGGLHHWAAMPNLELFSNAGFPFTRFADLSQTMVVLPPTPSAQEISLYLNLLAYFGEQTGYPALRVSVGDAGQLGGDLDYLVVGTPADQPAFEKLNAALPVAISQDGFTIRETGNFYATLRHAWWQIAQLHTRWMWKAAHGPDRNGLVAELGEIPEALIEGIQSPWAGSRSIVTITLRNNDAANAFTTPFLAASTSSAIAESVSVLHGSDFSSYRLDDSFYRVGSLPWYAWVRYSLNEFPWLIVLFTFVLGLFVVPWIRARLDQRSKVRLGTNPGTSPETNPGTNLEARR